LRVQLGRFLGQLLQRLAGIPGGGVSTT